METGISTIIIRAFRDQDYAGIVDLSNAVYADYPWSEAEFRHWDERYDGQRVKLERIVADDPSGRMLGWAEYHHDPSGYHPQKLFIDITVHPAQQNRGTGSRLYTELLARMAPLDPIALWANTRETFDRAVRFLERRGFAEKRRAWESRLNVAAFDPAPFLEKAARGVQDLQITTAAEEREKDPEWMQKLYDLDLEVGEDVPRVDAYTPQPLEQHMKRLLDNPDWLSDAHFLAKDGERYVAESNMFRSDQLPDVLYQGITGTRRAYRGRGVALALKLRTVEYARGHGCREIRTWNDTLNAPMLHINVNLGFVRQPAWITFEWVHDQHGEQATDGVR